MMQGTVPVFILVDTSMWAKMFLGGETVASTRIVKAVGEILDGVRQSVVACSWKIHFRIYLLTYGEHFEWLVMDGNPYVFTLDSIELGGAANLGDALVSLNEVMHGVGASQDALFGSFVLLLATGRSDDRWGDTLNATVANLMTNHLFRNSVRILFSMSSLSRQWLLQHAESVDRTFRHVGDLEQTKQLKTILLGHEKQSRRQESAHRERGNVRYGSSPLPARKPNGPLRAALNNALRRQGMEVLKHPTRLASYALDDEGVDDALSFALSLNFTHGLLNICYEAARDDDRDALLNAADRIAYLLEREHLLQRGASCVLAYSLAFAVADYLGVVLMDS